MSQAKSFPAHLRATVVLGVPLIGSQLAQFVINLTDTLMMGWYGIDELAALVLAGHFIFILILAGSGFAWAVTPLVASANEEGDLVQARRVTRMGLWASLAFAVVAVPVLLMSRQVFDLLGQDPHVSELAAQYLDIAAWSLLPALVIMLLRSFVTALEHTQVVLWITIGAGLLNGFMNYMLIFGNFGAPELGVRGAAIATVVSNLAAMSAAIVYVMRRLPDYELFVRLWRPDWAALRQVVRLGWPIGLTSLAEVGMFAASAVMMGWVGTVALAAHGIALQVATATFMVHLGLSQAVTVRAGQAYGRGDALYLKRASLAALALSSGVVVMSLWFYLGIPETMIRLFLAADNPALPEIIQIGIGLLAAAALFQTADAVQVLTLSTLRGVQDTRAPMIIGAVSYWLIGVPAAYVMAFWLDLGGVGIWLGLALGLTVAAILLALRFWGKVYPQFKADRPVSSDGGAEAPPAA